MLVDFICLPFSKFWGIDEFFILKFSFNFKYIFFVTTAELLKNGG